MSRRIMSVSEIMTLVQTVSVSVTDVNREYFCNIEKLDGDYYTLRVCDNETVIVSRKTVEQELRESEAIFFELYARIY